MYRIIGADGREYGLISLDQLRQWVAEGRANAQTKVLLEGTTDWKLLTEFPEFSATLATTVVPTVAPGPFAVTQTPKANPMAVTGIILGIISVTFGLCCCYGLPFNVAGIVFSLVGLSQIKRDPQNQKGRGMAIAGLVTSILSLILGAVLLALGITLRNSDILRK